MPYTWDYYLGNKKLDRTKRKEKVVFLLPMSHLPFLPRYELRATITITVTDDNMVIIGRYVIINSYHYLIIKGVRF